MVLWTKCCWICGPPKYLSTGSAELTFFVLNNKSVCDHMQCPPLPNSECTCMGVMPLTQEWERLILNLFILAMLDYLTFVCQYTTVIHPDSHIAFLIWAVWRPHFRQICWIRNCHTNKLVGPTWRWCSSVFFIFLFALRKIHCINEEVLQWAIPH